MPTYQYRCAECGESLEVVQKFSDEPLTVCPSCAGALRKVFSPVGVVFKGSGFYKTDSRKTASKGTTSSTETAKPDSGATPSGDGGTGKEKPAASGTTSKSDTGSVNKVA